MKNYEIRVTVNHTTIVEAADEAAAKKKLVDVYGQGTVASIESIVEVPAAVAPDPLANVIDNTGK